MNPILSLLKGRSQPSNPAPSTDINRMVADVKAGRVDPMQKAKELIRGLSPAQKARVKAALPMLQSLARRNGETDVNINAFLQEVRGML